MLQGSPLPWDVDADWARFWALDPDITYLNHGSFGACPKAVLEKQQRLREQLERSPVGFFARVFEELLDAARMQLAEFVGAAADELVFVPNATTGVNSVLRSLSLHPGDELLTTDLEYNACRNALDFVASRTGARVVVAQVPFPIDSPAQVVEAVLEHVSPKTRLALLDHITSQTALILPIKQLVHQLAECGVDTLVDGAHAPGMVPLNLQEIGATYYTGNCHKWLSAPKGAAFLCVRRDKQPAIRPLTISHGANSLRTDRSRFQLEFDWTGTGDPTAYLCVPEAIQFMGTLLPGGWTELMARNRAKALAARQLLCEALGVLPPCPEEMIASMAAVPLPDGERKWSFTSFQDALFEKFNIEVPVIPWREQPHLLVRVSAQMYNKPQQYEYLASAIAQLLAN